MKKRKPHLSIVEEHLVYVREAKRLFNRGMKRLDALEKRLVKMRAETAEVECSVCHKPALAQDAHLHQDKWIGDECCWDERLRSSE